MTSVLGAGPYALWPLISGFGPYLAMAIILQVVGTAGCSGRGAYTLGAVPRAQRVRSQAWMRAALNVGFTLGALLSGLALPTGSSSVIRAVPLVTAALLLVNAADVARLPDLDLEVSSVAGAPGAGDEGRRGALRNRAFLAASFFDGVLSTNNILLTVVIGWATIAVVVALAALGLGPSARAAERYLAAPHLSKTTSPAS